MILDFAAGTATCSLPGCDDRVATINARESSQRIVFGTWDRQVILGVNGAELFRCPLTAQVRSDSPNDDAADWVEPIAIGASGLGSLSLADIQVWRDIHYLPPSPDALACWKSPRLQHDEYLMLGDNSPLSCDARLGRDFGIVAGNHLLGTTIPYSATGMHNSIK